MENTLVKNNPSAINIGIKEEHRSKVVEILSYLLADEHLLYIKLRNYHWNIEGMSFQALHEFFQEQYTTLEGSIDDIAERIRSLGAYSPGSMQEFREMARLNETGHLNGKDIDMLENILADHEMIIQVLRGNVDETAEQLNDAGTADFLTALMEMHEKMAWMVRSHLRG
ncbi:MAG: DNA starvation/stationary phase protection protein [Bacteroidota bacterium]